MGPWCLPLGQTWAFRDVPGFSTESLTAFQELLSPGQTGMAGTRGHGRGQGTSLLSRALLLRALQRWRGAGEVVAVEGGGGGRGEGWGCGGRLREANLEPESQSRCGRTGARTQGCERRAWALAGKRPPTEELRKEGSLLPVSDTKAWTSGLSRTGPCLHGCPLYEVCTRQGVSGNRYNQSVHQSSEEGTALLLSHCTGEETEA